MACSIAGRFPDGTTAEQAIVDLTQAGFDPAGIGVVMKDRPGTEYGENRGPDGSLLVTVDAQGRDEEARQILLRGGAEDVECLGAGTDIAATAAAGCAPSATDQAPEADTTLHTPTAADSGLTTVSVRDVVNPVATTEQADTYTDENMRVPVLEEDGVQHVGGPRR